MRRGEEGETDERQKASERIESETDRREAEVNRWVI